MRSGPRARDDGFPPPPPELTGKPGLCASSAHPLVPPAVPEHLLGAALSQHWEHTTAALGLGATSGLP